MIRFTNSEWHEGKAWVGGTGKMHWENTVFFKMLGDDMRVTA